MREQSVHVFIILSGLFNVFKWYGLSSDAPRCSHMHALSIKTCTCMLCMMLLFYFPMHTCLQKYYRCAIHDGPYFFLLSFLFSFSISNFLINVSSLIPCVVFSCYFSYSFFCYFTCFKYI